MNISKVRIILIGLLLCVAGCDKIAARKPHVSYRQLLANLADPNHLARLDVPGTAIVTSFDPIGGNNDFNHPLREEKDGWVALADLKGPGYVSRFWFTGAEPKHRVRFFFDSEGKPRIDMSIQEFCGGTAPFIPPLALYENYCWYNYVPIPYAKRLVIMTQKGGDQPDGGPKLFHQINYTTLPKTNRIASFTLKLSPDDEQCLKEVAKCWDKVGMPLRGIRHSDGSACPPARGDSGRTGSSARESRPCHFAEFQDVKCSCCVPPGGNVLVFTNIQLAAGQKGDAIIGGGPAIIGELIITPEFEGLTPLSRQALLRDVILKICWDDQPEPSVAVPLGSFFGSVWQATSGRTMFFGKTNDSFYCRFPMPFRSKATITLENQMTAAVGFNLMVKGQRMEALPSGYGFFHAAWRRSTPQDIGKSHCVLNTKGCGRYAGCILSALSLDKSFWLLEGDEIMTRDNEPGPFWRGTGLEDYFNGGWYYQNVKCRPLNGLLAKSFFRTVQYRIHLPDPVLFNRSFNMIFERGPDNNSRGWMESVAFYYLDRPQAASSELLASVDRKPPVDEPQTAGFMLELFNYERFGDYRGAVNWIDASLAQNPDTPFKDILALRKAAYVERVSGIEKARPMYEKIIAETKDAAARDQARLLLWFHENKNNAILGLYANTPARCFLDGQPLVESLNPAKLSVASLNLKPGKHVLAIQCRYHPYPAWVQACLRTHSGSVITDSSWKQMIDPFGDWAAVDYNDSSWQVTGGTGGKGPPEEPFIWIEPNAFIDMQSLALGLFCALPWPDKSKPLVLRHVFEIEK